MRCPSAAQAICAFVLLTVVSACGGEPRARLDPATLPTITPTVATAVAGQGELLAPLPPGQIVVPEDGRYTFVVPDDWYAIDAGIAEEYWVQPPQAGSEPEVAVNMVRESIEGIENSRQYAEIGKEHGSEIYPGVVTISSAAVRVGDRPAWRWLFTADIGDGGTLFYQLFIIDGRQGFVLTGSAPMNADERAIQALFDSIAGSLTFVRG
jgi:hypothetical protein